MLETRLRRPTDSLMEDHVTVLANLARLRDAGSKLTHSTGKQRKGAQQTICEVARFFANELEIHLRKEEEALFPVLASVAEDYGGSMAIVMCEHDDLRDVNEKLQRMVVEFDDARKTRENIPELQQAISYICDLLTYHIDKEDNALFPMADDELEPQVLRWVAMRMREIDEGK